MVSIASNNRKTSLLAPLRQPVALVWTIAALSIATSDNRWIAAGGAAVMVAVPTLRTGTLRRSPMSVGIPVILIALIAFLSAVPDPGTVFALSKGFFYCIRPIIFIYLGYSLAREIKNDRTILIVLLFLGAFESAEYIVKYFSTERSSTSRESIRNEIGVGSLLLWLTPFFSIILWRQSFFFGKLTLLAASSVAVWATVLSTSRSAYVAVAAIILVMTIPRRSLLSVPFFCLVILISYLLFFTPFFAWPAGTNMIWDLSDITPELMPPTGGGMSGINEQWRGYETWRAFENVFSEGAGRIIFGLGLSKSINIGISQVLDGQAVQAIDVFHSAFSFVFVRAGTIGIVLYIWFAHRCTRLLSKGIFSQPPEVSQTMARLGLASVCMLIASSSTIAGLVGPGTSVALGMTLFGIGLQRVDSHGSPRQADHLSAPNVQFYRLGL